MPGGKLAMTEVALVVTVSEPGGDLPQIGLADGVTTQRTTDCDRGVLSFTKTNFMRCLLTYQSELMTVPVGRRINPLKQAQKSSTQLRQPQSLARAHLAPPASRSLALSCEGGR